MVSNSPQTCENSRAIGGNVNLPRLSEIGSDLTRISKLRLVCSLALPYVWFTLYFVFAHRHCWAMAVACLVCLSFVTYGSISHDLVHGNLGLPRGINNFFLTVIELIAIRSGHAYRMAHLRHHAIYPSEDDIEGAAARFSFVRTLAEGVLFQPKIWWWAVRQTHKDRPLIVGEGIGCAAIIAVAAILWPVTAVPLAYVAFMITGSWIIPLVTSYVPHDPEAGDQLQQTKLFRGRVASIVALEHLYHLEHHLYPAVPHHHWPALALRLDPFFERAGVKAIKFWF